MRVVILVGLMLFWNKETAYGANMYTNSFFDLECAGLDDHRYLARLERLCIDCYNLFRETAVYEMCRSNCYINQYFKGCIEILLLKEEEKILQDMANYLSGYVKNNEA